MTREADQCRADYHPVHRKDRGRVWLGGTRRAAAAVLALGLCLTGCGEKAPSGSAGGTASGAGKGLGIEAAWVPEAAVGMTLDATAFQATAICKQLQAIASKSDGSAKSPITLPLPLPVDPAKAVGALKKFWDATGLKPEDVTGAIASVSLEGIDFKAKEPDFSKLDLAIGIQLAHAISPEKTKEGILAAMAEAEKKDMVEIQEAQHAGAKIQLITMKGGDKPMPPLYVGYAAENRVLYTGTESGVKGALDRLKAGTGAGISPALEQARKALPAGGQVWVAFVLPEKLRQELREKAAKAKDQPGPQATASRALKDLQSVAFGIKAGAALSFTLALVVGSEDDAVQLKTLLDTTVLSMVKMFGGMISSKPLPLLDSFKTATHGSTFTLAFELSEADIKILEEKGKKGPGGGSGMGAGPMGGGQ